MQNQQKTPISWSKVSAVGNVNLAGIKADFRFHLINLEEDDEDLGLMTVYCFNHETFRLFTHVTQDDVPPTSIDESDPETSLFQALHPELFAGLGKINKIKKL